MKRDDVVKLLRLIRVGSIDVSADGRWVRSNCPLAPFTHAGGSDSSPSFGIFVNERGESSYNCFTCGTGSLSHLIHRLTWTVGISPDVHSFFLSKEFLPTTKEKEELFTTTDYDDQYKIPMDSREYKAVPVPPEVLIQYPLLADYTRFEGIRARDWFRGRLIDIDIAEMYKVRLNPDGRSIIFPMIDTDGLVYGLHNLSRMSKSFYHITPEIAGFPRIESWGKKDVWFGIEFVDFSKPVILVESQTDVLRLRTLGVQNVMGSCGSIGDQKLARVSSDYTYLGFDSDDAGARYCLKAVKYLHEFGTLSRLSWISVGIGDAGELKSTEQWHQVVANSKILFMRGREVFIADAVGKESYRNNYTVHNTPS